MTSLHSINPRADVLKREQVFRVNAIAAKALQDILISNLGPYGTYKMLVDGGFQLKITKDGNVLLKEMQIQHPTASIIARTAVAQDNVTGDGTTSILILVGEIIKMSENLLSDGIHPRTLSHSIEIARDWSLEFIELFQKRVINIGSQREMLINIARSSLNTKIDNNVSESLAPVIVDALDCIKAKTAEESIVDKRIPLDLYMVEVIPMKHSVNTDVCFIKGMVMDHGCRHPKMPKILKNCYILTCNVSLEYEKTEVNSGFFYSSAQQRVKLSQAERRFVDNKVLKIIELKRQLCTEENKKSFVIFNQKGIDPASLAMLANENIMALRRVKRRNMERLTLCCGGDPVNSVEDLCENNLGFAEKCWEIAVEDEKYTFVEGVKDPRSCCILIKAPTTHELDQIKDAIRDGLRACKNAIDDGYLVPGAGSFELACAQYLKARSTRDLSGKEILGVELFADALMQIPKTLLKNAGLDHQELINKAIHEFRKNIVESDLKSYNYEIGLDLKSGELCKPSTLGIWDGFSVKKHMIALTSTLVSQLVLIDEIIKAGKSMSK